MITPDTAALALAVAKGLVKFGGRLDRLLAEKVAVRSGLELTLPAIDFSPGPNVVLPRLQAYLKQSSVEKPGPIGVAGRVKLAALLPKNYAYNVADLGALRRFFALAFPDEAVALAVSPDDTFIAYMRESMPSSRDSLPQHAKDPDQAKQATLRAAWLASAFYVDPGADMRQLGYPVRVGLLVVDVIAEFGAENTQRFMRDEPLRSIVQAVLERFAEPDLESFDRWSPLLRHTLSATLNGVLDQRTAWQGDNVWLGATLGALVAARAAAGDGGDDYLVGLVRGQGYANFIGPALTQFALVLNRDHASAFQQIAADVLNTAAPLVQKNPETFGNFFSDHWSELLHAGLLSVQHHGPALLEGKSPVLREVLTATINSLAETPDSHLLTDETVRSLAQAVLGAVATHPELWQKKAGPAWVSSVIGAAVKAVSDPEVRATFTSASLSDLMQKVASVVAAHPEWLAKDSALVQSLVGTMVQALSGSETRTATSLANAAITGTVNAIAARPDLVGTKYPEIVAAVAAVLAGHVGDGELALDHAGALVAAAAHAAVLNPALFTDAKKNVSAAVARAVVKAAVNEKSGLVAGATLVTLTQQVLTVFARSGANVVAGNTSAGLEEQLIQVLASGLATASAQLGQKLDLSMVPGVLAALVGEWTQGRLDPTKVKGAAFDALFALVLSKLPMSTTLS